MSSFSKNAGGKEIGTVKKVSGIKALIGLMFTKPFPIYFETRLGIHTFGVTKPIDVLILDANNEIVVVRKNLFPNRLFFWNLIYNRVLELPQGTIKKLSIKKGSFIKPF